MLSFEKVPDGKLAHVSSCFYPSGVLFYPESKKKMLHMSVTLGRASVTVDIPAAHIFAAFKKACRYKRQLARNLEDVRHLSSESSSDGFRRSSEGCFRKR